MELTEGLARVKETILPLLEDGAVDGGRLMREIESLKEKQSIEAYSLLLLLLTHLRFGEAEAEEHWRAIMHHCETMSKNLGRDVGVRVALMDYFVNLNKKLSNPKLIELTMYEQIERSAVTDSLTGLYHHRHFRETLQKEIQRAGRFHQTRSLLFLDLDNFKEVNDSLGHLHGDMVLVEVSEILKRCIRTIDIAARYGGEEFAVLLPETDRYGAYVVGERIRRSIEEHFQAREKEGARYSLTLSGGVACYPDDAVAVEELIARADAALYQAKGAGKNQICAHHAERRNFIRITLSDTVIVRQLEPADGLASARTVNVSRGGVLFRSERRFPLGSLVEIQFLSRSGGGRADADDEAEGKPRAPEEGGLRLKARIVRLEEAANDDEAPQYEIGCCFVVEGDDDERRIMAYIQNTQLDPGA
ncbi:MAG: diguanylate cyclase [Acidobacteriota bacterium]|nr:MAG: diguanylate cyclase [Acidobacteriota bacterium]